MSTFALPGRCVVTCGPRAKPCFARPTPARLYSRKCSVVRRARDDDDFSGEWPVNWSLASYEDVGEYFRENLFKDEVQPGTLLSDVMSKALKVVTPEQSLDEIKPLFSEVTGMPVVQDTQSRTLVGVISKKDLDKPGRTVGDVMSSPPVAARADNKIADAACLMLKHKIHRIPVVDNKATVIGMITRTDVFTALAVDTGAKV